MIIYIHGFASSGNSSKVEQLRANVGHVTDVYAPTYPSDAPKAAIEYLTDYIEEVMEHSDDDELVLVGTSLGAYYARYLAEEMFPAKLVLINPVYKPAQMERLIGQHKHLETGEMLTVDQAFIAELTDFYVFTTSQAPTLVLLDKGDQLLDSQLAADVFDKRAKVVMFEGGDHRFAHLDMATDDILELYNTHHL